MGQLTSTHPDQAIHSGPAANLAPNADLLRISYGARLIGAAFVLLGLVFALAVWQIGSAGKEAAENGRAHAERAARLALGKLEPAAAEDVVRML